MMTARGRFDVDHSEILSLKTSKARVAGEAYWEQILTGKGDDIRRVVANFKADR